MLYHEIEGPADGRPLVLAGSLGTTLEMWDPQMEALTGHFRVVRFDHRGHGRSPLSAPTLVLAGADDPATPPGHARRIAEGIPGSRLVVLPGAAHLANVERPEAVSEHLVGHLLQG
ncbi:alpha/beta fold hydrolase [Streptosporangium sp. V21-05]|uniref:alpha/beta fold hydrolase n=1 Tax=Streptosporangium sp. V21-05 TaxID=3446115 RepID=UPI003F531603